MDANVVALHRGYDQTFQAREQRLINIPGRLQRTACLLLRPTGILLQHGSVPGQRGAISRHHPGQPHPQPPVGGQGTALLPALRHPHQVLKTDEMIFSAHLGHLAEVTDPVRYLCQQLEHEEGPAAADVGLGGGEGEYLRRFHSLPANTLWIFAEQGMTNRDFRYGFHKRQLALWGDVGEACLSRRFVDMTSLDRRHLRMVDMAEQMLVDMGLGEPRSSSIPWVTGSPPLRGSGCPNGCGPWCSTCSPPSRRPSGCPVRSGDPGSGHAGGSPPLVI